MRLCTNCTEYCETNNTTDCDKGYWISTDKSKSRTYNPIIFDCLEYDGIGEQSNFDNDHVFDLFITMSR